MQAPASHGLRTYSASLALLLTASTGCAHTKPLGQTFVALGAMIVGLGALDAAGVLGSKCTHTTTPQGDAVESCSGNSVAPQPVNILGIALGAGLIGGGIALWTSDSSNPPASSQTKNLSSLYWGTAAPTNVQGNTNGASWITK